MNHPYEFHCIRCGQRFVMGDSERAAAPNSFLKYPMCATCADRIRSADAGSLARDSFESAKLTTGEFNEP